MKFPIALVVLFLSLGFVCAHSQDEIVFRYTTEINGKAYPNTIALLRPVKWLKDRKISKVGQHVILSIPEFGVVLVNAVVIGIKPIQVKVRGLDGAKGLVIGTFKHYVKRTYLYRFKNSRGQISKIHATPYHRFYVENQHKFIAIQNVTRWDLLEGVAGSDNEVVHILCTKGQHTHCGIADKYHQTPTVVYNLEVYQRHVYRVGREGILVHNTCTDPVSLDEMEETEGYRFIDRNQRLTGNKDTRYSKGTLVDYFRQKMKFPVEDVVDPVNNVLTIGVEAGNGDRFFYHEDSFLEEFPQFTTRKRMVIVGNKR